MDALHLNADVLNKWLDAIPQRPAKDITYINMEHAQTPRYPWETNLAAISGLEPTSYVSQTQPRLIPDLVLSEAARIEREKSSHQYEQAAAELMMKALRSEAEADAMRDAAKKLLLEAQRDRGKSGT